MFKRIKCLTIGLSAVAAVLFIPNQSSAATAEELQAQIRALTAQLAQLKALLAQQTGSASAQWCYNFNRNLKFGDNGEAVANLKQALDKEGFELGEDLNNKEFGESTASAVVGFQEKYKSEILTPNSLKYGTGFVGKSTRIKLNQLYGCGKSHSSSSSSSVSSRSGVHINYLSPVSGAVGAKVKIIGSGFLANNTVYFGGEPVPPSIASNLNDDGIVFTVPATIDPPCINSNPRCLAPSRIVTPGVYSVYVSNANGISNKVEFMVTPRSSSSSSFSSLNGNLPPAINGVSGPTSLKVNEQGIWTIKASDPEKGNLSYYVEWGESTYDRLGMPLRFPPTYSKTSTVTHAYMKAGIYNVSFTVVDDKGQSSTTSISVNVDSTTTPSITVLSPNGGERLVKGSQNYIKWKPINYHGPFDIIIEECSTGACLGSFIARNVLNEWEGGFYYSWDTKSILPGGGLAEIVDIGKYRIRVIGSNDSFVYDTSDSVFNIVSPLAEESISIYYPNPTESKPLAVGGVYSILWISKNIPTDKLVTISTYNPAKNERRNMVVNTANDGHERWTVPGSLNPGENYHLVIEVGCDSFGKNCVATHKTDKPFKIISDPVPYVNVVKPHSVLLSSEYTGVWWDKGHEQKIEVQSNVVNDIVLQLWRGKKDPRYVRDIGLLFNRDLAGKVLEYKWTVPFDIENGDDYKVFACVTESLCASNYGFIVIDNVSINGRACFLSGTKVTLANGFTKNIEDIKEGDYAISFDLKTNQPKPAKVLRLIKMIDPSYLIINGNLRTVPDQRIYTKQGFKQAKDIKVGEYLMDKANNWIRINSVSGIIQGDIQTYDLVLDKANTFYADDYLVHSVEE